MYLKRLELNGFKSFAKKTTLIFETPITAIVGPNGSGKSNVAEAFRWSLGEQSIKSLRGKRGEDLIFNGSRTLPRMNRADVTLIFDNSKKQFTLEFPEVHITREVYRDGRNEYLLNKSKVRLRDIIELLSQVSLGASSHHIISQNEADRILSATPKVRKMMIEDALSLRIYHFKIAESERKLEKTNENIKEAESLRREISGHLRFLGKEAEKIEKARALRAELSALYKRYIPAEVAYLEKEEGEIREEEKSPKRELATLEGALAHLFERGEIGVVAKKEIDALAAIDESLALLRKEKDDIERHIGRLEGMLEIINQKKLSRESATHEKIFSHADIDGIVGRIDEALRASDNIGTLEEARGIFLRIRESLTSFSTLLSGGRDTKKDEGDILAEIKKLEGEKEKKETARAALLQKEKDFTIRREHLVAEEKKKASKRMEDERSYFEKREKIAVLRSTLQTLLLRAERFGMRKDDYEKEKNDIKIFCGESESREITAIPIFEHENDAVRDTLRKDISRLKIRIEEIGPASEAVGAEYEEAKKRDIFLENEIKDLKESATSLRGLIDDLQEKLEKEFMHGVGKINKEFQHFFELMFGGGQVKLDIITIGKDTESDEEMYQKDYETEERGVNISVNLPRKKIRNLEMLSGGERALTSIALLFAMSQVNPPPFLILDETDAALDEANSRKYGDMLENLAKKTQLILITHNRETMLRAGVLYGVTMGGDGISKLLSVKFDEAVQIAK